MLFLRLFELIDFLSNVAQMFLAMVLPVVLSGTDDALHSLGLHRPLTTLATAAPYFASLVCGA